MATGKGPIKSIFTAKAAEQRNLCIGFSGLSKQLLCVGNADILYKVAQTSSGPLLDDGENIFFRNQQFLSD